MAGNFLRIKKRKPRKKKPKVEKKRVQRAITNAKIVTVLDGRRVAKKYYSGEPLIGVLE